MQNAASGARFASPGATCCAAAAAEQTELRLDNQFHSSNYRRRTAQNRCAGCCRQAAFCLTWVHPERLRLRNASHAFQRRCGAVRYWTPSDPFPPVRTANNAMGFFSRLHFPRAPFEVSGRRRRSRCCSITGRPNGALPSASRSAPEVDNQLVQWRGAEARNGRNNVGGCRRADKKFN